MAIKLNDLLKLTNDELENAKVCFHIHSGNGDPIELYKKDSDFLSNYNSQNYKVGQVYIGTVQIYDECWLLFNVVKIAKEYEISLWEC